MSLQPLVQAIQEGVEAVTSGKRESHGELLGAIEKLRLAVETPAETLTRTLYQLAQNAALRMAVEIGLPGALVANGEKSANAAELALATKSSKNIVVRIMRALSAMKMCDEVGEEDYKANPLTQALASPGFDGGTKYMTDSLLPTAAKLANLVRLPGFPNFHDKSPFELTTGTSLWSWLAKHPEKQKDMMNYMGGRRKGGVRWPDVFPIQTQIEEPPKGGVSEILLVDIGGNQGHDLKMLKELHPDIPGRVILMDLPEAIKNNKSDMTGIEMIPYDFFTPQPIKGARFYFFRAILHDWSDKKCQQLLGNTVRAMDGEHSRLLINEFVLPDVGCTLHPALLDITMMALVGGAERTEKQWRKLLRSVGLDIVKIWSFPGAESVIETKLAT